VVGFTRIVYTPLTYTINPRISLWLGNWERLTIYIISPLRATLQIYFTANKSQGFFPLTLLDLP